MNARAEKYLHLEAAVSASRREVDAARSALGHALLNYEHAVAKLTIWAATLVTAPPEEPDGTPNRQEKP